MLFRFVRVDGAFGSVIAMVGPVDTGSHGPQFALSRLSRLDEHRSGGHCSGVLMLRDNPHGLLEAVCCDREGLPSALGWIPALQGLIKTRAISAHATQARVNGVEVQWSNQDTGEGQHWWLACQGLLIDG